MSAELPLDLGDLGDLEAARDELRGVVMSLVSVAVESPNTKDELVAAVLELGSVHATIERAIEALGGPTEETP
jgi:hypothetical protein